MTTVALSIVIPTFETAAMTLACCRAALDTSPDGAEVVIVDDASTDGTAELVAAHFPMAQVVRLPKNRGFAAAANAGVAVARGEIILLLNSDTELQPGAAAAFLDVFARDARLGVAGARLLNRDGTPQWSGGTSPTLPWLVVLAGGLAPLRPQRWRSASRAMNVDWVSGAAMALRREVWNDAGPLRENYRFYAQDIDFCARARSSGWSVRIVEDAHAIHQIGGTIRRVRNTSALDHDPGLLWLDLLDWARAHHGRIWASSARLAMGVAAAARIAGRSIRALTLRGDARRQARLVTAQYAAALRQLLVEPQQTRSDRTR